MNPEGDTVKIKPAKIVKLTSAAVTVIAVLVFVVEMQMISSGTALHLWPLAASLIAFTAGILAFSVGRILEQP